MTRRGPWRRVIAVPTTAVSPGPSHYSVAGRGGFRHFQHVRPDRGPHKKGPHKKTKIASERLASNCQSAAAAIVVCIAARVLNKMSMMTTVRVGPDSVG